MRTSLPVRSPPARSSSSNFSTARATRLSSSRSAPTSTRCPTARSAPNSHPDLLIAAAAEAAGVPILHYDEDYDRIAAITGQPAEWLAPRGT